MKNLCIRIQWLDDRYHGKNADGEPEWPPSPLRLFQAMLAAAFRRFGDSDSSLGSLRWLQSKLPAPIIVSPAAQVGRPFTRFVPNNDSDKELDRQGRLTAKKVQPTFLLEQSPIHYIWRLLEPLTDDDVRHIDVLCEIVKSIVSFGWGVDMAFASGSVLSCEQVVSLQGERWVPDTAWTSVRRRVPCPFTLDSLIDRHKRFVDRLRIDQYSLGGDAMRNGCLTDLPPLADKAFRIVSYRRDRDPVARPYAAFRLLQPETGKNQTYAATDPVKVAGMVRGAAGRAALDSGRPKDWVDEFVYGHHEGTESFPRFSYLPLPSIQPVVGVGRINRVLIVEPIGAGGNEVAWIKRLLAGHLANNEQGRHALLMSLSSEDNVLKQYVTTSQTWTTVTPVALPGSDDGLASKTSKLLAKMFNHAGYSPDLLQELEYHRVPFSRGAEDAKRYRPGAPHHLANCTMYHMRIRWRFPMPGPIALGAGRHCGLGVLAAIE